MNTLEDHCSHNNTGMPLESLAYDSTQWCPSGDPVLICIIGTFEHHWKATGRPLEAHWKHTGYQQLFLQWHSSVHWGLISRHTGLPLDCHWITTGSGYGGDLEFWRMTLKNDRSPQLSNMKLYASFCHHMWFQTWVTVRKSLSCVLTSVTLTFDLWPRPFVHNFCHW